MKRIEELPIIPVAAWTMLSRTAIRLTEAEAPITSAAHWMAA
jgi:hypothetical protein